MWIKILCWSDSIQRFWLDIWAILFIQSEENIKFLKAWNPSNLQLIRSELENTEKFQKTILVYRLLTQNKNNSYWLTKIVQNSRNKVSYSINDQNKIFCRDILE